MAVRKSTRSEPPQTDAVPTRRLGRGLAWFAVVLVLVVGAAFAARAVGAWTWPSWSNPFAQRETDRSGPALLQSMQDLSRYVAAEGTFQVVIDLQRSNRFVPDVLLNQRTLFVAVGSVEGYVDFSGLADGAVVVSEDGTSVQVNLPAAQLTEPRLDVDASYVFAEERGLINRVGDLFDSDPDRLSAVYQRASEEIAAAATASALAERAQQNTEHMLRGMLDQLGFEQVTITYVAP